MKSASYDAVYMLHWEGWDTEVVSNRWHYARRWLRHAPVVMVVPDRDLDTRSFARQDPRIPGLTVLHIPRAPSRVENTLRWATYQAADVAAYMQEHDHQRVILWQYNPYLIVLSLLLPAVCRVHHATENYLDMAADLFGAGIETEALKDLVRATVLSNDLVICCSTGVRDGLADATGRGDLVEIPNGCDFEEYAGRSVLPRDLEDRLTAVASTDRRAIFAGNLNERMDFALMLRLALELPDVAFVYVGATRVGESEELWQRLLALPNVVYIPEQPIEAVSALYHWATVGIIPYVKLPTLVRNGLPLKALEMAATGMPVVSSLMEPLKKFSAAVHVSADDDDFLKAVAEVDRAALDAAAQAAMRQLCRAHDYDVLFARAREAVEGALSEAPAVGDLNAVHDSLGTPRLLGRPAAAVRWADLWSESGAISKGTAALALPPRLRRRVMPVLRQLRAKRRNRAH